MTAPRADIALIAAVILISSLAVVRWHGALDAVSATPGTPRVAAIRTPVPTLSAAALDSATSMIADNDPFRLANAPSAVAYDPAADLPGGSVPQRAVVASIRPTFLVRGIIGGPPWQAIMDGIPGQPPGTIVRSGMTFDRLSVRSVGRDTVVVQAPDTIWKLTMGGR